jgi:N-methylhydantoinase A
LNSDTRIGVDSGGTFTDFIVIRRGRLQVFKKFSTPHHPDEAILEGLAGLRGDVIHGSTVATNAFLERKGARTALITTEGFEDVLVIGRQTRRELYNVFVTRPLPLVPDELRLGIAERTLFDGTIAKTLVPSELEKLKASLQREGVESVAVCLLFSFTNNAHEDEVANALATLQMPVSLSSRILPEYREYERTSTTVINAYLAPLMSAYLGRLDTSLEHSRLRVMQSNGGAVVAATAAESPVRTIVSGPAGGVVGAYHVAAMSGYPRVITFDMGGTSTDVSLCDGGISVTHEAEIDGMPVGVPMIDINTVGAGGGSIAGVDAGGALQVGPRSSGAEPGPICYGKGGAQLTVTDANVILGRLPARFFLGGTVPLAVDRIPAAAARIEWVKKWKSLEVAAQGIVEVVNNNMEQAIRLISVERGHDPRDFALVCFGGAGGLHAADLARALAIPKVVVPQFPGALSALGLLLADVRKDYSKSLLIPVEGAEARVQRELKELHHRGEREMRAEGIGRQDIRHQDFLDLRYRGQSYELTVPFSRNVVGAFHRLHERRYGYADAAKPVELVNVRSTFTGRAPKVRFRRHSKTRGKAQSVEVRPVWFEGKARRTMVYDREMLGCGQVISGPAIVGEYSSTTLVPPGFQCAVDEYLNLVLTQA